MHSISHHPWLLTSARCFSPYEMATVQCLPFLPPFSSLLPYPPFFPLNVLIRGLNAESGDLRPGLVLQQT